MDLGGLLQLFTDEGPGWVRHQRAEHRSAGRILSLDEKEQLSHFFEQRVLDKVRIARVPVIPNPPFYAPLFAAGIPIPLDFSQSSGITFDDTILVSELHPVTPLEELPLIFHELVHVVQFDLAGVEGFVTRYVAGWATNGFVYERIPLEAQAYALAARFSRQPTLTFSVRAEVAALVGDPS